MNKFAFVLHKHLDLDYRKGTEIKQEQGKPQEPFF